MTKEVTTVLILLSLACGTVFADDAAEEASIEETPMRVLPKNTITVDVAPTVFFLLFTGVSYITNPEEPMYAIGIAAQYERQITEKFSVAGRFEYGIIDKPGSEPKWKMSSILAEGHGRYYPGQGVFFLDGTLGYANITADFSSTDREVKPVAHLFKFGGKLGWRLDFKSPGGFVFEPAVGYYGAVGTGLITGYENDLPILGTLLNFLTTSVARSLFVDGLRFSLSLGYRF